MKGVCSLQQCLMTPCKNWPLQQCRDLTELEVCTFVPIPGVINPSCVSWNPRWTFWPLSRRPLTKGDILFCWAIVPLDGIGPAELGLDQLAERLENDAPEEMIIATNPTVEGEATSYYLQRMAKTHNIRVTRIAHGVPLGGELEYTDQSTLAHAFGSRLL